MKPVIRTALVALLLTAGTVHAEGGTGAGTATLGTAAATATATADTYAVSYVHRYDGAQGSLRWAVAGTTTVSVGEDGVDRAFPEEGAFFVSLSPDAKVARVHYHGRAEGGATWLTASRAFDVVPGRAVQIELADHSWLSVTLQAQPRAAR